MATTARARVRAELTREIADAARSELAEVGAAGLSLRAVARRLELAPSALYRYYDSRDHLLTALIVDAYDALAAVARRADRDAGADPWERWVAIGRAVRRWAARRPQEWALVFGSPVPGYRGDDTTTGAALGLHRVAITVLVDAYAAGRLAAPDVPRSGAEAVAPMAIVTGEMPGPLMAAGLAAWVQVLGHVSLERFGHFVGVFDDADAYFDTALALGAGLVGLRPPA
jgi:AcrR family transcriptional regulator